MAAPLAKRLQVRPGQTILTVDAPPAYADALGDLRDADIDAVSQVAVDDTWSALRLRPVAEVGRRGERR